MRVGKWGRWLALLVPTLALAAADPVTVKLPLGPADGVLAFAPGGQTLAVAAGDGVKLLDPTTGQEVGQLRGAGGPVRSLCFSPNGRRLAGEVARVVVWDVARPDPLFVLPTAVEALAFSADGQALAGAGVGSSRPGSLTVWGVADGQARFRVECEAGATAVTFLAEPGEVVTGHQDGGLIWWDAATGRRLRTRKRHVDAVRHLVLRDGALLSVAADGQGLLWDGGEARVAFQDAGLRSGGVPGVPSADGRWLAADGGSGRPVVRDPVRGLTTTLTGPAGAFDRLTLSADGRQAAAVVRSDGVVRVWRVDRGTLAAPPAADDRPRSDANSVGMRFARVPAGSFEMGSADSPDEIEAAYAPDEKAVSFRGEHPQHTVRIRKPLDVGRCEVTYWQFAEFVADTSHVTDVEKTGVSGGLNPNAGEFTKRDAVAVTWRSARVAARGDDHPVTYVSWNDATAYCRWLSAREGRTYRLPTEAEWEYACRAGTTTRYWCGDDPETLVTAANVPDATFLKKRAKPGDPLGYATIRGDDGYAETAPVGSFKANPFGLHDMHGNVWEWCADWHAVDYYANSPATDPAGPDTGTARVTRGGCFM